VINKEGEIITNHHVVRRKGETIKNGVVLNGTIFVDIAFKPKRGSKKLVWHKARVLKVSAGSDLALLKIIDKPDNLRPIKFSKNDDIEIGHDSYAIGHPGGHSNWSYTQGAISQLRFDEYFGYGDGVGRRFAKMIIQTTSAIYGGNSGGPLIDENGKLIGVNSFAPSITVDAAPLKDGKESLKVRGYSAINFAVSVDDVKDFVEQKGSTDVKKDQFYINKFSSEFEGKIQIDEVDSTHKKMSFWVDSNNNGVFEIMVRKDLNKDKNLYIDIWDDKKEGGFVERHIDTDDNGITDLYIYHDGERFTTKGYDDDEDGKIDRYEKM
nr:serine protease [Candidatus Neomarinimicrobiota bacterium]